MNEHILTTPAGETYPILTGAGLLQSIGTRLAEIAKPCRVMLVTDENVAPLYLDTVRDSLASAGFSVHPHVVPAGENSKSIPVLGELLEAMCEAHLTRSDLAAALGGGVIGDLTGFAAGCYLRGIRFVQLPTTLLAAVDASVGGKTAVNLVHGKNLAGLFHQPIGVYCDTGTLNTLTPHTLADGAAEAIKTGILGDGALFAIYESGDPAQSYEEIIARAVAYKAKIVAEDPTEKGVRKLLNLGHTAAHAIEILSDFSVSHGHAVAIGTAIVTRAAQKRGMLGSDAAARIIYTLRRAQLPTECPYTAAQMAQIAALDKKAAGTGITVILPVRIGECVMQKMPLADLEALFSDGLEGQS